jgi:hypothetical protein
MFTIRYNGMYINGRIDRASCYVTDDYGTFKGVSFKSVHAAKIAITRARNSGVSESR